MKIKVITQLNKSLENEWEQLWNQSSDANYVNAPQWFASVLDCFNYKEYRIIAVYENDILVAIGGLIKEKRYGVAVYTMPPGDFVCGLPFLIDLNNKEIVKVFVNELMNVGTILLDNVPEEIVTSLQNHTNKFVAAPYTKNYILTFEKDSNGKVILENRKKLMYEARKIEDKLVLKRYYGDSKEAIKIAFAVDKKSRKQMHGYNAFSATETQNFYKTLAIRFKKNLCIHILYLEDTPISYDMGFLIKDTYYGSQIAFDESYRKYSPGKTTEVKLIESLASSGVKQEDFGSGDNHVKRLLAKDYRQLYKIVISKNYFAKFYITKLYQWRDLIFNQMRQHVKVYAAYRMIRRFLKI